MSPGVLNSIAEASNLIGVILLFRYGMPFAIPTEGMVLLVADKRDNAAAKRELHYKTLGYVGLFLIIAGTSGQIVANLLPIIAP